MLHESSSNVAAFQGAGFVSDEIADQLQLLLCPWWNITNLIEADVSMHKMTPPYLAPTKEDMLLTNARGALSKYLFGENEATRSLDSPKQGKKRKPRDSEDSIE